MDIKQLEAQSYACGLGWISNNWKPNLMHVAWDLMNALILSLLIPIVYQKHLSLIKLNPTIKVMQIATKRDFNLTHGLFKFKQKCLCSLY
jgi:hypothetical protein